MIVGQHKLKVFIKNVIVFKNFYFSKKVKNKWYQMTNIKVSFLTVWKKKKVSPSERNNKDQRNHTRNVTKKLNIPKQETEFTLSGTGGYIHESTVARSSYHILSTSP